MKIQSGSGKPYEVKVDDENRLYTYSISEAIDRHVNGHTHRVWSIKQSTTPVGANDYLFYLKNTGTETLAITDVRAWASGASKLYIQHVTGTPTFAAGADLTPVNRFLGSSVAPTITVKEDTNTTGLTSSGDLFSIPIPVADTEYHLRTSSNILIPQGQAIAMYTTGTTAVETVWSLTGLD